MAIVTIPEENRVLQNATEIAAHLADIGIAYERWEPAHDVRAGATPDEVLEAYGAEIEELKRRGGYVTADVIDVGPQTPNLEAMLSKFNSEHWHDEDEVRFIISGRGLFHIRPRTGPVTVIEVEAGDLVCVPKGKWHWFDLCGDRRIKAIRLFQDASGWTPHYTGSGVDRNYQAVCLGPAYVAPQKG
jgi:1,2-dihydroxy-3-keto-5-methylthiopentene dioxygenase